MLLAWPEVHYPFCYARDAMSAPGPKQPIQNLRSTSALRGWSGLFCSF